MNNVVTKKGTVLTQMSKFWFNLTKDILPNHMISTDVKDMPEFFQQEKFDGNSMLCRKLNMIPVECIVRGYITGSGWASYQKTGEVCGIRLPEGLKESDKLPEPIYTPSTKAEIGDHDENISFEQSVAHLEKILSGKKAENMRKRSVTTRLLFIKNVRNMHLDAALSLRTQNLNSDWMKMAISCLATRCLHRTAPVSGRQRAMSRDMGSRPLTSSSHVTG